MTINLGHAAAFFFHSAQRFFVAWPILLRAAADRCRFRPSGLPDAVLPCLSWLTRRAAMALLKRSRSASNSAMIACVSKGVSLLIFRIATILQQACQSSPLLSESLGIYPISPSLSQKPKSQHFRMAAQVADHLIPNQVLGFFEFFREGKRGGNFLFSKACKSLHRRRFKEIEDAPPAAHLTAC